MGWLSLWSIPTGQLPSFLSSRPIRNLWEYVEILGLTENQAAKVDRYPIPKIEDLFVWLSGGKVYYKLDLSHAYQQLLLDEHSKKAASYQYTERAVSLQPTAIWGVLSALHIVSFNASWKFSFMTYPMLWCILMTSWFQVLQKMHEHLTTLDQVLEKLEQAGPRLKQCKCEQLTSSVVYWGHRIDQHGTENLCTPRNRKSVQCRRRQSLIIFQSSSCLSITMENSSPICQQLWHHSTSC